MAVPDAVATRSRPVPRWGTSLAAVVTVSVAVTLAPGSSATVVGDTVSVASATGKSSSRIVWAA